MKKGRWIGKQLRLQRKEEERIKNRIKTKRFYERHKIKWHEYYMSNLPQHIREDKIRLENKAELINLIKKLQLEFVQDIQ